MRLLFTSNAVARAERFVLFSDGRELTLFWKTKKFDVVSWGTLLLLLFKYALLELFAVTLPPLGAKMLTLIRYGE